MAKTTKEDPISWVFDENESATKTHAKIFGERVGTYDEILKVAEGNKSEMLKKLIDTRLEDIPEMANALKENMGQVLVGIVKHSKEMDQSLANLMKPDSIEQKLRDGAVKIVADANADLESVKNWSGLKKFFSNQKKAIAKREAAIKAAIEQAGVMNKNADDLYEDRIQKAELDVQLEQYQHMSTVGIDKLNAMADINKEKYAALEIRHEKAIVILQRSAKDLETLNKSVQGLNSDLETETKNLEANFVTGTPEFATQRGVVDELKQKYEAEKTNLENMQAVYNSKEKFAAIIQAEMTALEITARKMRALAIGLRSDNSERTHTFPATVQLIKNANILQVTSGLSKVGHEMDQRGLELAVGIASAADKDALERLYKHPEDMKRVLDTVSAFDSMIAASQKRWDDYRKMIAEGYDELGGGGKKETTPTKKSEDELETLLK